MENRDELVAKMFTTMSAAKRWELGNGTVVEVNTPFTTRSRELMQLYNGLRYRIVILYCFSERNG